MSTNQDQALAVRGEFSLPAQARADALLEEIEVFQALVRNRLIDGHDYGVIPGTQKPTLLLPGAQKITKLAQCRPHYTILTAVEDWDRDPQPLFAYTMRCELIYLPTGDIVDEGVGECNSMESKYRWRQSERECPTCGTAAIIKGKAEYGGGWLCWNKKDGCGAKFNDGDPAIVDQMTGRVLNPDVADQNNTILKMAKKRCLVDAALSVGRLSDLFTQDMEDQAPNATDEDAEPAPATNRPPRRAQNGPSRHSNQPISGPDAAYNEDGQVETRTPQQAAAGAKDVKSIKNGGTFMGYVNARWPGHTQQDILGCLNVQKISDLTWTAKNVSGYVATLIGFWGTGEFDEDGVVQDPETEPAQEEGTDASPADEAAVVQ